MSLPTIDQPIIDRVFDALETMEVELDENPLPYGPRRLNQKTAQARGFLTECEAEFLKISRWLQKYKSAVRAAETSLLLSKKDLLSNDPEVRGGRNVADRDAMADVKLKDQVAEVARVRSVQEDLEILLTVIRAKRSDLRDVQGRLRDQIKLCQEEIGLGGRWGKRPPPGSQTPDLDDSPKGDSLKDLGQMFAGEEPTPRQGPTGEVDPDELLAEMDAFIAEGVDDDEVEGDDEVEVPEEDEEDEDEVEVPEDDEEVVELPTDKVFLEGLQTWVPVVGYCAECHSVQYTTPSGVSCDNGHGGADTLSELPTPPPKPAMRKSSVDLEALFGESAPEPEVKKSSVGDLADLFGEEPEAVAEATPAPKVAEVVLEPEPEPEPEPNAAVAGNADATLDALLGGGELPPATSIADFFREEAEEHSLDLSPKKTLDVDALLGDFDI